MRKKYIEPKIKAIGLDPDQAILQVCQTFNAAGGAWMMIADSACFYGTGTGGSKTVRPSIVGCVNGLKRGAGTATRSTLFTTTDSAGS